MNPFKNRFSFFLRIIILIPTIIFIFSCRASQVRYPSQYKSKSEIIFNLFPNEGLAKKDYNFELIDLNKVLQKEIRFSRFTTSDNDSQKAVLDWISQLKSSIPYIKEDVEFTHNKLAIRIKVSDFKRLDKALELLTKSNEPQHIILKKQIAVISAFNQKFKDPLELQIEILALPFELLKRASPFAVHERRNDNDNLVVPDSSFWSDRSNEKQNMKLGPGEFDTEKLKETVCKYDGPKRGFGIHQGFKAKCFNNVELKIKLGEIRASPLNSRIYHRLGYNVPPIHAVEELKMAWDRKMFTEISSSKKQFIRIKVLGGQIKTVPVRKKNNFDKFISHAVLKDGKQISKDELFNSLFPNCKREAEPTCHLAEANYDVNFENQIDHVVFKNIAVVEENKDHEFGAWAYDELDHERRAEVRALVMVGAFTGNHDLRKDNNKLVWSAKNFEIKHYISDPGSGFGSGTPFASYDLNDMKWEIMSEKITQQPIGNGKNSIRRESIVINGYKPSVDHDVFSKLTLAEARWMGRRIAGITEDELIEAMIASRFSAAELLLAKEKLVSMQKNIIKYLELEDEFPALAARQINRKINYIPTGNDLELTLSDGRKVKVSEQDFKLVNGVLSKN